MKIDKSKLPYRKGVIGLVTDSDGKFLVVQMLNYEDNQWRFPGGGVDENESDETALLRELGEELGSNKFKIIKKSQHINKYDWPDEVIQRQYKEKGILWRGQEQTQFLIKFVGKKSDIAPDANELKNVKWVTVNHLKTHFIFPNQWGLAKLVIEEFFKEG